MKTEDAMQAAENINPEALWSLFNFWKSQGSKPVEFDAAFCLFLLTAQAGNVEGKGLTEAMVIFWTFLYGDGIRVLRDGPLPLSVEEVRKELVTVLEGDGGTVNLTVIAGPAITESASTTQALDLMKKEASK